MQVAPVNSAASVLTAHAAPHGLAALKRGNLSPTEQRAAVSSEFEAILLRQFLQESVGSMMGGGDKASGNVYGYMLTDSLAQKISEGRGMGLAPIIAKQLTPRGESAAAKPATQP
jgi:Rod binding domain-containing protein